MGRLFCLLVLLGLWGPQPALADQTSRDRAKELIALGWKAYENAEPKAALDAWTKAGDLGDPAGYWYANFVHGNLPFAKEALRRRGYHLLDEDKAFTMRLRAAKNGYPEAVWWYASRFSSNRYLTYDQQQARALPWKQAAAKLNYPPALHFIAKEAERASKEDTKGLLGLSGALAEVTAYRASVLTLEHALRDAKTYVKAKEDYIVREALEIIERIESRLSKEQIARAREQAEQAVRESLLNLSDWSKIAAELKLDLSE